MIREEKYGEYVIIRNQVSIDEMLSEEEKEQFTLEDSRFNVFTREERDTFEKTFKAHMSIVHGK